MRYHAAFLDKEQKEVILVKPIAFTAVNWKAIQAAKPDLNCLSVLAKAGIKPEDPAALPWIIAGSGQLRDTHALRFAAMQFLVVAPTWDNIPTLLDSIILSETADPEGTQHKIIILSGTADCWRTQIIEELSHPSANIARRTAFGMIYDTICSTGFKALFNDLTKQQKGDGTYTLKARP